MNNDNEFNPVFVHKGEIVLEQPCSIKAKLKGTCGIGAFSYIDESSVVNRTVIGRYCSIARNVLIGPSSHPTDWFSSHLFVFTRGGAIGKFPEYQRIVRPRKFEAHRTRTVIGNDVWIGANAVIRRGVRVGDGAIIGAGAVVVKDVQPYEIVGGVPARRIRLRFDEALVARFLALRWWNYDLSSAALEGIDYSDAEGTLAKLEFLVASGALAPLKPRVEGRLPSVGNGGMDQDDEEDSGGAAPAAAMPSAKPQPEPVAGDAAGLQQRLREAEDSLRAERASNAELRAAALAAAGQIADSKKAAQVAQQQAAKTREMLSFQLGAALLQGTKSFKSFAALPGRLLTLRQEARRRRGKS